MSPRLAGLGRVVAALSLLYLFLVGLEAMGLAFKFFGKGLAQQLITTTENPFVGLFIGVLATSLVQSSSTTTSITVGLVAGGAFTIEGAVPIIMGANIGTSVTNTLVSLGHVTRKEEFRRAFAGATIHDFFNWLTVLFLLPLEIGFGYLSKGARVLADGLEGVGGIDLFSPVKAAVRPAADAMGNALGGSGALLLVAGILCTFVALKYLVDVLRSLFTAQAEKVLHRTVFRNPIAAIAVGALLTVMVQSSSITTSSMIPLIGAGLITLEQLFPFTVGANLGTTITALLAALVTGSPAAVTVAFSHLLFNLNGAALIYGIPWFRRVPLAMARWAGDLGVRNRPLAILYILLVFFGIPLLLLVLTGAFKTSVEPEPLGARGRSHVGRVAVAMGPDARRTDDGDAPSIVEEVERSRWAHAAATRRASAICSTMLRCSSSPMSEHRLLLAPCLAPQLAGARPAGLLPRAPRGPNRAPHTLFHHPTPGGHPCSMIF